jgi:general secretion pathway protein G
MRRKSPGFTLMELMITVAILSVLASMVVVKLGDALEKTKEGATKGNLGTIMAAISVYYGDNSGIFPVDIATQSFSPYLRSIPPVLVTHSKSGFHLSGTVTSVLLVSTLIDSAIPTGTDGWKYNKKTGNVWVYNSQTDTMGRVYSMYGYE